MMQHYSYRGLTAVTIIARLFPFAAALLLVSGAARADDYTDTIKLFKNAGESATFFKTSYGYAVFPTIGEAGFIVGGAGGKGRVYERGKYVGDSTVAQVSVGFQAGAKAYSEIIFFEDKRALEEFQSGHFEFGADASAVAITAGAGAGVGTNGANSSASVDSSNAGTDGAFFKGMAVFTIAKGGLMYAATISGQQFTYTPRGGD
jgi:lipid-binding SYLF domain-containing protein